MSYVNRNLHTDEKVVYTAKLHWIIYAKAITFLIIATAAASLALLADEFRILALGLGGIFFGMAALYAIKAWWRQFTTEVSITTRRIVLKSGFIYRHTQEMALPRVESVYVDQSVLGRVLDFGSVHARGTGESVEHLHEIARPVELRNSILTH